VHDKLSNGRSYRMLTVLDEYTRQALAVEVRCLLVILQSMAGHQSSFSTSLPTQLLSNIGRVGPNVWK
jgi:hypothetical protein